MKIAEMTVKTVDVWSVENVQAQLEKALAFADLLITIYSSPAAFTHFTADDGEKLDNLLIINRNLVDDAYTQTTEIINEAYGVK